MSRLKKKSLPHGLGKSLIKKRSTYEKISSNHSVDLKDGYDWGCLQSITEQSHLDEFLLMAEVTGTEYAAEKMNVTFVNPNVGRGLLSQEEKIKISNLHEQYRNCLRIPRRPQWNEETTPEELKEKEKDSFLQWRRQLAEIQEIEGIVFTPFEKNLEFWRQLWRVVERSDIVVQTVDARNCLLFRCEDLEKYVKECDSNKINMILISKADLLTERQRQLWAEYFESINLPCAFFSALEEGKANLKDNPPETDELMEDETFSAAGHLLSRKQLLNFFRKLKPPSSMPNKVTTVGLVGYPNVGKSSTINCLLTYKKVSVSATPGKTKHFQTLYVDDDICLCDCPGLVMPSFVATKADLIVNGILPIDQMKDHVPPINLILSRIPRHILELKYGIHLPPVPEGEPQDRPPTAEEFLNAYGYMRGFMTQRGLPDNPRSARYILKDYVQGKLLYCISPPNINQNEYHTYPPPGLTHSESVFTPQELQINNISSGSRDLDKAFFKKVTIGAHNKGLQLVGGQAKRIDPFHVATDNANHKPWKKHHNKNKREKLRRVYADLDK